MPPPDLTSALSAAASTTDTYMRAYLDSFPHIPAKLKDAIAYSLFGPGKRIRPALAIFCAQAIAGESAVQLALPPAAAVEMIHCFSLIHDDLPAMDNDDLRRGRPTNHKVYGDALAILAGDALNTLAFEVLVDRVPNQAMANQLVKELALATGGLGMIGGQVLDTCHPEEAKSGASRDLPHLQQIHRMKTGALINAACRMGAIAASATPKQLSLIDTYGHAIGLAFQIVDDLLDVTATPEQMGENTGKDAQIGKLTYPGLLGIPKTREHLTTQVTVATDVATVLGSNAQHLADLAHHLATRTS